MSKDRGGGVGVRHPKGVSILHTGYCPKGGAAVPVRTVTLVNKRNLLVVRKAAASGVRGAGNLGREQRAKSNEQ
jgi:hypothetical protein